MTGFRAETCPNGHAYTPENTLTGDSAGRKCRICRSENGKRAYRVAGKEHARARGRKFREDNPTYHRDWARKNKRLLRERLVKRTYGLSLAERDDLIEQQDGRCLICGEPFNNEIAAKAPCIDHDHTSGVVRGILCRSCNVGLGYFRDDPEILQAAISYVGTSAEMLRQMRATKG